MNDSLLNTATNSNSTSAPALVSAQAQPSSRDDLEDEGAENVFAFSLSSAISALEINASRALEVHGARPDGGSNFSGQSAQTQSATRNEPSAPTTTANSDGELSSGNTQNRAVLESATRANNSQPITQLPSAPSLQSPAFNTTAQPIQAVQLSNAATTARQQTTTTNVNIASAKENASKVLYAKTPQANTPLTKPENFARLVAQRLASGDTRFEVRLDPPELGKIDVKLIAGEKSTLTLSFEQQNTLDLFRRDGDALKSLLSESGFDEEAPFDIQYQLASEHSETGGFDRNGTNRDHVAVQSLEQDATSTSLTLLVATDPYQSIASRALEYARGDAPLLDIQV